MKRSNENNPETNVSGLFFILSPQSVDVEGKKLEAELISDQQPAGHYDGSVSNYTLRVADLLEVVKDN